ncbi:hypothetical protein S245_069531, partial [Arachis hypogaea]
KGSVGCAPAGFIESPQHHIHVRLLRLQLLPLLTLINLPPLTHSDPHNTHTTHTFLSFFLSLLGKCVRACVHSFNHPPSLQHSLFLCMYGISHALPSSPLVFAISYQIKILLSAIILFPFLFYAFHNSKAVLLSALYAFSLISS